MQMTKHIQERMNLRNFTLPMLEGILAFGEWNARGDQLRIQRAEGEVLQDHITEMRRVQRQLKRYMHHLERLKKKGSSTLVVVDSKLITVY